MSKKTNVLNMTPDEARAFIRKVMGPSKRVLEGEEYKHVMLVLALKDPIEASNNQHSWTEVYEHNGHQYHVTYGFNDEPWLEEILDD